MMRALILAFALGLGAGSVMMAEPAPDPGGITLHFFVPDTPRRYAVLVQAPKGLSCPMVRYRIEGANETPVAAHVSAALGPGQLQVLRLKTRLPAGDAAVRVTAVGCQGAPVQARRVVLGRLSPDHGWRGLADVEGHALGQGQRPPIVQGIGRPPHIGLPGI